MSVCVFEILHFLPLALIAVSTLTLRNKFKLSSSFATLILSLIGLVGGIHSHVEHNEFFGIFDPCNLYVASFVISALTVIRAGIKIRKARFNAI